VLFRSEFPHKHPRAPQVYSQRTRPCSATEILSSKHFPEANQGNLLVGNVIGFQGILQYKLDDSSACLTAKEVEPIVSSSDPNFRPVDIEMGPDGAIYFTDWQNPGTSSTPPAYATPWNRTGPLPFPLPSPAAWTTELALIWIASTQVVMICRP